MRFVLRGVTAVAAFALLACVALAEDKDDNKDKSKVKGPDDKTFVAQAAMGNAKEIKMGTLAAKTATDSKVKDFAEKMVKDHTKAHEALKKAAGDAGIDLPADKGEKEKPEKDKHDLEKGKDFDAQYVKMMVESHTKSAQLYELATKSVKNEALRKYAEETLPVVKEHLSMAKKLHGELGGKTGRDKDKGEKDKVEKDKSEK